MSVIRMMVAFCLLAVPALAQSPADQAKARFKRGIELYDQSNFRGALAEFERAYELSPSSRMLYNIGQVQMELQDSAGALKAFNRYLKEEGPDVPAARREQVLADIERLKGRVGHLSVDGAPGAEVLVDDASVGFIPLPDSVPVNAGRHRVTVHQRGKDPVNRVVDVAGQQQLTVAIPWDRGGGGSTPEAVSTASAGSSSKLWRNVAWVGTGAFAVTGGVFAGLAFKASADLKALKATYPLDPATLNAQAAKVSASALPADIFGLAAVAVGGLALYLTLAEPASPDKPSVSLSVGSTGFAVAGTF